MGYSRSYKARGIVLRKTKLGEKDTIVTLLSESGALIRAVAKGARKPGGTLAARMELFTVVDCMLAKGRSLDVVSEARIAGGVDASGFGLEQSICAAPIAELICDIAQEDLEQERLFAMTDAAFKGIASSSACDVLAIVAADLLKTLALTGFRPQLESCVRCGNATLGRRPDGLVRVSISDGGVVCEDCSRMGDTVLEDERTIAWAHKLLYTRFGDIPGLALDADTAISVIQFSRQWARVHTGRDLKSLGFLLTSGLF